MRVIRSRCAARRQGMADAAKNYASTQYGNAAQLQIALAFSLGVSRRQEAALLVVGSTMDLVTP